MSISIEQILATTEGQQQIGTIMATNDLYEAVMQQMSLLDIDSEIVERVTSFYQIKSDSMSIEDKDSQVLISESDLQIKNLILSAVSIPSNELHVEPANSNLSI